MTPFRWLLLKTSVRGGNSRIPRPRRRRPPQPRHADPGYTATDLNGRTGTQSVEEGTDALVRMAQLDASGPTGTFVDRGGAVPW